jgi:4-carboxymuconolactone decarboxylase
MRIRIWFSILIAAAVASSGQSLPSDINKDSLSRFPPIKREQMDEKGKQVYDHVAGGAGKLASPTGPASIGLYSPGVAEPMRMLNDYLRKNGVLGDRLSELAILVAAREVDEQYVWSAHEPAALKAGVAQPVIDVIKYGKDLSGLSEKDSTVIRFGRQMFREKKMSSDVFVKARELFGMQGTVELTALMGDYQLNGLLLKVADQHLPPERKPLLPPR